MRPRTVVAVAWRDLPFWFLSLAPFALLDFHRNQLGGAVLPGLLAFLVPAVPLAYAFYRGHPGRGARWVYLGASGLLLAFILLGWTGPPVPGSLRLRVFEAFAWLEFFVLGIHAARFGGRRVVALLFGVGLVYGLILENLGVAMGFFTEEGYLIYVPGLPAPLATALGWCIVFYPLWWVVPRLVEAEAGPGRRALVATGLALALDLQLDPLATAAGFWVWHPDLSPGIRGVPLVNFSAWTAAVLPLAWAMFHAEGLPGSPALRVGRQLPVILAAALLLVLVLTGITEVQAGWPSWARFGAALSSLVGGV